METICLAFTSQLLYATSYLACASHRSNRFIYVSMAANTMFLFAQTILVTNLFLHIVL